MQAIVLAVTVAVASSLTSPSDWPQFRLYGHSNAVLPGSLAASWRIVTGGGFSSSPTIANGRLYIGNNRGDLFGARLLATGPFGEDDLGVSCYHSKTGAVELYLNHLADGPGEYVVVDCTAGADSFASGLFTRFDLTILVAEPTRKGISVYRQWQEYARGYDVALAAVGNKVQDQADLAFLREHAGEDLLTWLGHEPSIRAMEQGRAFALADLSLATQTALHAIKAKLDAQPKDWDRYARQAAEFHVKNALAWANRATGSNLAAQVDPGFTVA